MTTVSATSVAAESRARAESFLRTGVQSLGRAAVLSVSAVPGVVVPIVAALFVGAASMAAFDGGDFGSLLSLCGAGVVGVVSAGLFVRRSADWTRSQLSRWYGVRLPAVYGARPALELDARGHWWTGYSYHRSRFVAQLVQLMHWAFRDRTTRGEMLWLILNPAAVIVMFGPIAALVVGGVGFALTAPFDGPMYGDVGTSRTSTLISLAIGLVIAGVGVLFIRFAVRAHADLARRVLDPEGRASRQQLTRRVAELTETRADAVGNQAAELRRIERDLHDGAQARLVAIGMTLGTIEHLMDTDPTAARELLSEARQSSVKALQELRDLVRGIHPPVLAERGLGDAVRVLALDSALPTEVCVSLPDRPPAPIEAAAYFSICELMANAAKHSGADNVWVDILYRAGTLRITVTDDGHGVADPTRGSGLRGIERRLGTFDGVLAIDSTSGGPTTITLELPCELSSPRTSTSSEKG
ncbi:histidine kinase [Kitasatospora sp. NPDC050543]|uniref:sensor histidine kinase n=1 Tax=Kitasatospora sp. NPDC050543 TaxID=3364054 RepID=UPI00378F7391